MTERPWPPGIDQWIESGNEVVQRGPDRWTVGSYVVWRERAEPNSIDEMPDGPIDLDGIKTVVHQIEWLQLLDEVLEFPVPEVVGVDGPWLVTSRPEGIPADRPERHPEPAGLAPLIGQGLRALHTVDIAGRRPGGEVVGSEEADGRGSDGRGSDGWHAVVARCRRALRVGSINPLSLPPPYDRYQADRLIEMLEAVEPREEVGPVLCHGWPTLDRLLVDGARFGGFDGFESLIVTDPHLDLAVAHLGIAEVLGPEAVFGLYEGYGVEPDVLRLDRAILAAHLLGTGAERPASR